jgi:hypothetical protein
MGMGRGGVIPGYAQITSYSRKAYALETWHIIPDRSFRVEAGIILHARGARIVCRPLYNAQPCVTNKITEALNYKTPVAFL